MYNLGKYLLKLILQEQKDNFFENLSRGCHGNAFHGVTSKSTNLAKITILVSMETRCCDNSDKI